MQVRVTATATRIFSGCSTAQPSSSIGTSRRKSGTDFLDLFRFASLVHLPLHAHSLTAQKKGFSVCGGWSKPQHRHPLPKKTKKNGFFVRLGCYELHEINTNALRLFAHFFRRLPRKPLFWRSWGGWQSSKKIERTIKTLSAKIWKTPKLVLYLLFCLDKKMKSFFFN